MTNSEALDILRKESKCRHGEVECYTTSGCLDECSAYVSEDDFLLAIDVAIEALELCVMIEDDGR